jgi:guanylate kinase
MMLTAAAQDPTRSVPSGFAPGGFLLVLSGPSGAGKGTLVDRLLNRRPDCVFAVSATTRPKRAPETDGVQYHFITREEFEARRERGYFLEWAEVHGNLYGTPVHEVDEKIAQGKVVVLDIDVQGGASVRRARPDAISIFIYPPSLAELQARLRKRATDKDDVIATRLGNAPGEMAQYVHYDYLVVNDDIERASAQLLAVHDAERARIARLTPRD